MPRGRSRKPPRFTREERAFFKVRRFVWRRQIKGFYEHQRKLHGSFFYAGDELLEEFTHLARGQILACCSERHAARLEERGKKIIWHAETPPLPMDILAGKIRKPDAAGPLPTLRFSRPVDAVFICERVEEQLNLHDYLVALRQCVKVGGLVAMVVPNVHHELIDRHFNLFTAGQLVYNLVRAGWDCREARLTFDGRFINVLLKRVDLPTPWPVNVDEHGPYTPFPNVFQYCSSEFVDVYRTWQPVWNEEDDPST